LLGRAPYFHNGSAKTLLDVAHFYETRFGLTLTHRQESDLVVFLSSLRAGEQPVDFHSAVSTTVGLLPGVFDLEMANATAKSAMPTVPSAPVISRRTPVPNAKSSHLLCGT